MSQTKDSGRFAPWERAVGTQSEKLKLFFVQNRKGVVGRSNILESFPH